MATKALVVSIVGPTGSGKSALAIEIAARVGGEIINFDSLQLYRDLNIGTGKPSADQRTRVRHRLFDVLDLDRVYSAGEMQRQGRAEVEQVAAAGRVPILVGGTGFYYRAVLRGLSAAPPRVPELRERLTAIRMRRGELFLADMLQRVDAPSAARIMPRDQGRILRALEVRFATGVRFSDFKAGQDSWLGQFLWLGLGLNPDRQKLYGRIDRRVGEMLQRGWVDEVKQLLRSEARPDWKSFDAIGYREVVAHLQGGLPADRLLAEVSRQTRNYAKRQLTWFRKEPGITWLAGFGDDPTVVEQALQKVEAVAN